MPRIAPPESAPDVRVSFEFFPPKTDELNAQLWDCITALEPLAPDFVSVTYGAGGSTRDRTHDIVARIASHTGLTPAAHLTCVGATREEVDEVARGYWDAGVRHIVALRGDPPDGVSEYAPHPGGYAYAADLVAGLRKIADFEIFVAAYPEGHPAARSLDDDIDNLKRKLDAGATTAISQFFFDVDHFRRFMDRVAAAGITAPVIPGILPVMSFATVQRFASVCGTAIPAWMPRLFDGLDESVETRKMIAAALAFEQCRALQDDGHTRFHFYTLNRPDLTRAICHILGLRTAPAA
nr:methylenetetrahydrofolate reductase [NAD(P)H] [Phaeovibrio sulfidiphilus]